MINASFDAARGRQAAISRVYQYDTGQRLRLHGLPSQGEMTDMDELLYDPERFGGNRPVVASVLVQYGYEWSERTEDYAAIPQEDGTWMVDIPDEFLKLTDPVHIYVYVFHGEKKIYEGDGATQEDDVYLIRGRTMYEGVFTPIARPAPRNTATQAELEQWAARTGENGDVVAALSEAEAAIEYARAQKEAALAAAAALDPQNADVQVRPVLLAQEAAQEAEEKLQALVSIAGRWEKLLIETATLAPGASPDAAVTTANGKKKITLCLPKGDKGDKGDKGATGPADMTISAELIDYGDGNVRYKMNITLSEEDE